MTRKKKKVKKKNGFKFLSSENFPNKENRVTVWAKDSEKAAKKFFSAI